MGSAYRNITQNGQQDVNKEICITAALEQDTETRKEDGKDGLAEVGSGERQDVGLLVLSKRCVVVLCVACVKLERG